MGALAKRLGLSEAAVRQHLQVLRKTDMVPRQKRGYWPHYGVEKEMLRQAAGGHLPAWPLWRSSRKNSASNKDLRFR